MSPYSYSHGESRQAILKVTDIYSSEAETVQYVCTSDFVVWFRMLGNRQSGCLQNLLALTL